MPPPTKREFDAAIKAFLNPPPMTIDQAMLAPDPVNEVLLRLVKPVDAMTAPEHMFHSVMYFFSDTHNGGLHQTMTNSTGELTGVVVEFADRYGTPELRQVLWEIVGLFPDSHVPLDREEREQIVDAMAEADHLRMDHLTSRLCALDSVMRTGLLALLKECQHSFTLTCGYGAK